MNLEVESYEGELRYLREVHLEFMQQLEGPTTPPYTYSHSDEEFDSLSQHCANQQQKIHAMALTCAGQETRLRAISKIASEMFRHKNK